MNLSLWKELKLYNIYNRSKLYIMDSNMTYDKDDVIFSGPSHEPMNETCKSSKNNVKGKVSQETHKYEIYTADTILNKDKLGWFGIPRRMETSREYINLDDLVKSKNQFITNAKRTYEMKTQS